MTLKNNLSRRLAGIASIVDALPDEPTEAQLWAIMFSLEEAVAVVIRHKSDEAGTKSRA